MRLVLVCAVAAAGVARAGDGEPVRIDLSAPIRWQKGDVVTRSIAEERTTTIAVTLPDGRSLPARENSVSLEVKYVRRCDEVAADGSAARSLVYFDTWLLDPDGPDDESLEGAFVEVTPAGWSLVAAESNLSPAARAWLGATFGPASGRDRSDLALCGARNPVADGDRWTAASQDLIRRTLGAHEVPGIPAGPQWSFVASSVPTAGPGADTGTDGGADARADGAVRVAFDLSAKPAGRLAVGADESAVIGDDSTFRVEGSATGVPSRWHHSGETTSHAKAEIHATTAKLEIDLTFEIDLTDTRAKGGEMPGLPARDVAAGPVVRLDRASVRAGDVFTETVRDDTVVTTTDVDAAGAAGAAKTAKSTLEFIAVRRCDEVDAAGRVRRETVTLRAWRMKEGDAAEDASLEGAAVEVGAKGWKIASPDVRPTDRAKRWLDGWFADGAGADDPVRAAISPDMPVAAGQTWKADPRAATAALRRRVPFPLDFTMFRSKATLDRVEAAGTDTPPHAAVTFEIHVPVQCVAGCGCTNAEVLKGGTLDVTGASSGSPGDWGGEGTFRAEGTMSISVPGEGEGLRRLSVVETRSITRTRDTPPAQ